MKTPLLQLTGVEKAYGPVTALRHVDLELSEGQTLSLLGPNGAGKSTLLRIAGGLAAPTRGRVEIQGKPHDRHAVGYLGHATLLYPELTARENLIFAGRLYGVADPGQRAMQLLEEEGLAHVAHRRAGGFSRGMAQRLAIARARVHDPRLLLLDEPFTGLDVPAMEGLTRRLHDLRDQGQSWLLVTHDVKRAASLADSALLVIGGRIVESLQGGELNAEALGAAYKRALESSS
ncbi:MAG: ABC transporter ATP-binding protein [Myxococcota bacterium]|nr:ABC transporter ATP-binding protein [Myxococcota bacterium]